MIDHSGSRFAIRTMWIFFFLFSNKAFSQIFDTEDFISQMKKQSVNEIHIFLGGQRDPMIRNSSSLREALRSRLVATPHIPVVILNPSLEWAVHNRESYGRPTGLAKFLLDERVLQGEVNYRLLTLRSDYSEQWNHRMKAVSREFYDSYFAETVRINENLTGAEIRQIEEIVPSFPVANSMDHLFAILDSRIFKKVYLTIVEGDQAALQQLMQFLSFVGQPRDDSFAFASVIVNVALAVGSGGAASSFLGATEDLEASFPYVEFLVAKPGNKLFYPLDDRRGIDVTNKVKRQQSTNDSRLLSLKGTSTEEHPQQAIRYVYVPLDESTKAAVSRMRIHRELSEKALGVAIKVASYKPFVVNIQFRDHLNYDSFQYAGYSVDGENRSVRTPMLYDPDSGTFEASFELSDRNVSLIFNTRIGQLVFSGKELFQRSQGIVIGGWHRLPLLRQDVIKMRYSAKQEADLAHRVGSDEVLSRLEPSHLANQNIAELLLGTKAPRKNYFTDSCLNIFKEMGISSNNLLNFVKAARKDLNQIKERDLKSMKNEIINLEKY